jgi:SAM-dependent methyltransferase
MSAKTVIKQTPVLNKIAIPLWTMWLNFRFPGCKAYWEKRYASGGHSGYGSYGKFAEFKAEIINSFVRDNSVKSVIEFGCGDGNQLSLLNFKNYIGLDVSDTAIGLCRTRLGGDKTKSFFLYDTRSFKKNRTFRAELSLSLDVIFHLTENEIFESYMRNLFSSSEKFVMIYSTNFVKPQIDHVRHRRFTDWVENNLPEWKLTKIIKNIYPKQTTQTDFFIYKKVGNNRASSQKTQTGTIVIN